MLSGPLAGSTSVFSALVAAVPLPPSSLSGVVFADFNDDGQVDFGEQGIAGVTITLTAPTTSATPSTSAQTTDGRRRLRLPRTCGRARTRSPRPAAGRLHRRASTPSAPAAGASRGDQFDREPRGGPRRPELQLRRAAGRDRAVQHGPDGRHRLLEQQERPGADQGPQRRRSSTQLGDWLAATFPHMFGTPSGSNNLAGKSNAYVASFFQSRFVLKGEKLDAQVLATALAVYVTNATLEQHRRGDPVRLHRRRQRRRRRRRSTSAPTAPPSAWRTTP